MKKIKILRIIARLNIGGPAIHAVLLTEGLNKEEFESLLVCGSIACDEGDMSYYAADKNVKPYVIPELKRELNLLNDIKAFKKIYNLIKIEKPDIIHTHTAKAGTLGRLAGVLYNVFAPADKRIKLIHAFHGHVFSGYFNKLKAFAFIWIEKFLAYFTCQIITVSESVKKELVSLGVSNLDKIKVIPLGFELEKFLDIAPKDENNFLNIGIVGRLVPVKNHRLFLEAAAGFVRNNPQVPVRFKIIGDGELRRELEAYAREIGIYGYTDFSGWQKDLTGVYSDLDIVALTSKNEGTPVSLIEAMACARAIVATNVGGVPDLLGSQISVSGADFKVLERGIIVMRPDAASFTCALEYLIKNKDLRKDMGTSGRAFANERFSRGRLISDMEGLYKDILKTVS